MIAETRPTLRKERDIATMFDRIAPRYDFLNALLSMRQDKRWRRKLLQLVPSVRGGVFLDVATGTGDVVLACAESRPEYRELIGVDISERMMSFAKQKAKNASLNSVQFTAMSAEELHFESNSVDCLTISFGLRNVIDKEEALKEFARVLKPHGRLLILEFFTPPGGWLAKLFKFYFHAILPKIGALLSDKIAYSYLPESVEKFYSLTALDAALTNQGLKVEKKVKFLFGSCCLIQATKRLQLS